MAIQSNSSDVQVAGGGIPLFTGIASVSVVAVNPTLEELVAIGVNMKTEPNYSVDMGDKTGKLCFWIHNSQHDFTTRLEILVGNEHRKASASGKFQITNNVGQVTWAESPDKTHDWFKNEGVRRTYPGEEILINFIKAWANIPNDGECAFDTIDAIMKGDVTELKSLIDALKENKVRVMLGVKDGKYQNVYNRHFGRLKPQRDALFTKALNDEYGAFKAEYNADLKLQPYAPELVVPTETEAAPAGAGEDLWS